MTILFGFALVFAWINVRYSNKTSIVVFFVVLAATTIVTVTESYYKYKLETDLYSSLDSNQLQIVNAIKSISNCKCEGK